MRVASILCENLSTAKTQIAQALPFCDVLELRLDYLKTIEKAEIETLRREITLPVIFTLRTVAQGGLCDLPDADRLRTIQMLATLSPDYFDLEFDTDSDFIRELKKNHPAIQIIGSYHDFKETPENLEQLFQAIQKPHFNILKIATFANSLCDTLRLLIFLQHISRFYRVIGMAMGEYGQASRILAPIVGSMMTYGSVDEVHAAAPGQLTLQEMTEIYRVHLLNRETKIYALLGFPVIQSPGHLFHNAAFAKRHRNAVYVKLKLAPEELSDSISLLRQLPFYGFSVTIPHKETVVALLNEVDDDAKAMHAVNTIKRQDDKYLGFNTDGVAGVEVLENKIVLENKRILILGAGGSASALGYALTKRGAKITLCNRTLSRAQTLAKMYHADAIDFEQLLALDELDYDVILNTLPADAFAAQCTNWQIPRASHSKAIAMDIVLKPLDTLFLQRAGAAGYDCIAGDALYEAQALRQLGIWFSGR